MYAWLWAWGMAAGVRQGCGGAPRGAGRHGCRRKGIGVRSLSRCLGLTDILGKGRPERRVHHTIWSRLGEGRAGCPPCVLHATCLVDRQVSQKPGITQGSGGRGHSGRLAGAPEHLPPGPQALSAPARPGSPGWHWPLPRAPQTAQSNPDWGSGGPGSSVSPPGTSVEASVPLRRSAQGPSSPSSAGLWGSGDGCHHVLWDLCPAGCRAASPRGAVFLSSSMLSGARRQGEGGVAVSGSRCGPAGGR